MTKKRDFFILFLILLIVFSILSYFPQNFKTEESTESNNHGFGPQLNFSKHSINNLVIISVLGVIITMVSAVFLERNISKIASKTGKGIGTALMGISSSIPLLVIVLTLALERRSDLILTNIIGANIANLTLVLGILAFIKPLKRGKSFQRGFFALIILLISISTIFFTFGLDAVIERDMLQTINTFDGYVLIGLFLLFLVFLSIFKNHEGGHLKSKNLGKEISLSLVFGIAVAWFANTTVRAFIIIAENYSVPTIIIGSVIGVIGASLPELAIGVVCLIKKEHESVFSNLITSNIVNFNLGLGMAVLILGSIMIENVVLYFKIPFMMFVMFIGVVFFLPKSNRTSINVLKKGMIDLGLTRFEGLILLLLFAVWIFVLMYSL